MGFKLGDIVKNLPAIMVNPFVCPTGKKAYPTKAAARKALQLINITQRRNMRAFRCNYCDQYHLGHRRGSE